MLRITDDLSIDEDELQFEFARSSGPGGQNVNKVETKVRLLFDLQSSRSLNPDQRSRIEERLSTRITKAGVLHISSQRHRTREANRKATIERFVDLLANALEEASRASGPGCQKRLERSDWNRNGEDLRKRPCEQGRARMTELHSPSNPSIQIHHQGHQEHQGFTKRFFYSSRETQRRKSNHNSIRSTP